MARSIFCLDKKYGCNWEFSSEAEFLAHKKAGHTIPGKIPPSEAISKGELPPGIPPEALPSPEFIATVEAIEARDNQGPRTTTGGVERKELPPANPIMLKYVYQGEHETCRRQPSTLEIEVAGKFFAIAYCDSCKTQIKSKEVVKL